MMIRNHLKMSFRNLSKRKLYSAINFVSLSIAVMIGLLVFVFVQDELIYDGFHANGDNLFLLYKTDFKTDDPKLELGWFDATPDKGVENSISHNLPFLELVRESVPEIEKLIRVEGNYISIKKDERQLSEYVNYVDSDFFEYFSFTFLYGQPSTALKEVKSAVITDEMAMRLFGRVDVVGEAFLSGSEQSDVYQISGVVEKPINSSLEFNIVLNLANSNYYKEHPDDWYYNAISAFIFLNNPENAELVSEKISKIYTERFADEISSRREMLKLSASNPVVQYGLKNIQGLYLDPSISYGKSSSPLYSIILIGIGLLILLIACINYLSINVASSGGRQMEVSVRKVMGASGGHLRTQFYLEALIVSAFSVLGGFTLMQLLLPKFNLLAGKAIELSLFENIQILGFSLLFALVLAFLAGIYPAQILSRFRVVNGLKGNTTYKIKPVLIRSMVVFQFVLCLFFISMGLTMNRQFNYISNKDLGFDKEQIVYVRGLWGKTQLMKQELASNTEIESVTGVNGIFTPSTSRGGIVINSVQYWVHSARVDFDFFKTFNIPLLEGEYFSEEMGVEALENRTIMNKTLYDLYKSDTAMYNFVQKDIQGVVNDFHFESLQKSIGPFRFNVANSNGLSDLFVKISAGKTEAGIAAIKAAAEKIVPEKEIEVSFLNDYLNSRYKDSQKWKEIINVASVLGVVIACIGLFGLTGINMANRTKEIGIRKVLGAGFSDVLILLNRQTIWLIVLSTAISLPISYYFMEQWLSGFAYSTSITADIFLLSTCICLLVVAITVSFHSVKSTLSNPIDSLRYE
ncbi:FtsX-like permease family protein [uncultured Roseivirga sp.]|uniref:ABC transporter permease n=1 Tax=uncultured Roseivirga sp. TaxID=543088 RepID=UPI0030D77A4E